MTRSANRSRNWEFNTGNSGAADPLKGKHMSKHDNAGEAIRQAGYAIKAQAQAQLAVADALILIAAAIQIGRASCRERVYRFV